MSLAVRPDFVELDGAASLGSVLLQGTLSGKGLASFSNNYERPGQSRTAGDEGDEAPSDDDWKNL